MNDLWPLTTLPSTGVVTQCTKMQRAPEYADMKGHTYASSRKPRHSQQAPQQRLDHHAGPQDPRKAFLRRPVSVALACTLFVNPFCS